MSSKAQAYDAVPDVLTVEIPLSEKGLTDLAAMLVKSGRMSAASFREWAHRTQQFAGRWANEGKTTNASSSSKSKASKTGPPAKGKKQLEQEKKDKDKISALKLLVPSCKLGNWEEVKNLSQVKHDLLQEQITEKFQELLGTFDSVKDGLLDKGLNEDQVKVSRAFMPHLPKLKKERAAGQHDSSGAGSSTTAKADGSDSAKVAESKPKVKAGGLLSIATLSQKMATTPKDELTEYFGRYNWTSVPEGLPKDTNKKLGPGAIVVGSSTNQWKKLSIVSKAETMAKFYNQEA